MHFKQESMTLIIETLRNFLESSNHVTFTVLNPDIATGSYAGEIIEGSIYRSYRAWLDLAQILKCRMLTPKYISHDKIELSFEKLNSDTSFHTSKLTDKSEKYGSDSLFSRIHKNEEPAFIDAYTKALHNINIQQRKSILNLGVNRADEFDVIEDILEPTLFQAVELTGIDHSQTALESAQKRFKNALFYAHDINNISQLPLKKYDLIITIGTLQSPGINFKPFFNSLIQNYLNDHGAIILGFPNSRWIDGEMVYGAKMPNYRDSDLSILINDIHYCKKYLQQKQFKVRLFGKEYIFLSAFKT